MCQRSLHFLIIDLAGFKYNHRMISPEPTLIITSRPRIIALAHHTNVR